MRHIARECHELNSENRCATASNRWWLQTGSTYSGGTRSADAPESCGRQLHLADLTIVNPFCGGKKGSARRILPKNTVPNTTSHLHTLLVQGNCDIIVAKYQPSSLMTLQVRQQQEQFRSATKTPMTERAHCVHLKCRALQWVHLMVFL